MNTTLPGPWFREARRRRQVIIVTHNANLVVNTDVDQTILQAAAQENLPATYLGKHCDA